MITEQQKRAQIKYDKANTRKITFKFNLKIDADILERLDSVNNRQGYVKELIRRDIATPQESKKGEWIKHNDDCFDWYECSECGFGDEGEMLYSSKYDVRTNYCPQCGADMNLKR